jgi:hypothetical protein
MVDGVKGGGRAPQPLAHCNPFRVSYSSPKFGACIVAGINGTLVEDNMCRFKGGWAHFRFNERLIYTYDGASAKFSTITHTKRITVQIRPKFTIMME